WSEQGCVSLDFASRTATAIRPVTELAQREFDLDDLSLETKSHLKDHLFDDLLQLERHQAAEQNAILEEIKDFAGSISEHREPRVTGLQGRNVLEVAEQIVHAISQHRWDGDALGRIGPMAMPMPPILRGPHWNAAAQRNHERREAG